MDFKLDFLDTSPNLPPVGILPRILRPLETPPQPYGCVQLGPALKQGSPLLLTLPLDLWQVILSSGVGPVILETCRSTYRRFAKYFHWIDNNPMRETAVGFYADYELQTASFGYAACFGFEIKDSGMWTGLWKKLKIESKEHRRQYPFGLWTLEWYTPEFQIIKLEILGFVGEGVILDDIPLPTEQVIRPGLNKKVEFRREAFEELGDPRARSNSSLQFLTKMSWHPPPSRMRVWKPEQAATKKKS